ncbi:MAG: high-potential iron-sulfur protein, partial [Myxococcota bacterium]
VAAAAAMVQALAYVNQSAKADQRCENCQLYTAGSGGKGKCQLFPQGLVASPGWCSSWAQKMAS